MLIAVCAKQIPDPADAGRLDPVSHTLDRSGKAKLDDSDSYGVEMALRLVEAAGGGEVVLMSMVPGGEVAGVRAALAMGAHRAVVISDEALAGSDALSTAKVLAAAVKRIGPNLVLTATESTDGYTGTLPAQMAELLGWPSLTFAKQVEVTLPGAASVTVQRQTEAGYDVVQCELPAVVSVTAGVVEPRFPSFKGIMSAKSKPVEQLSLADLGIEAASVGAAGSRQSVVEVQPAEERKAGEVIVDDGDAHEKALAFLEQLKLV
ncbi:MAG: electron transfer flavoprotein subunit beta/FixA family protein [Acidimicrobiales bacterium]